ncbi:hypothetical protein AX16_001645 [Volvariella volvacea WC 439]|nr:hypothetical protein AX16_001645 [Volvariella volvacea WC 439]
MISQPLREKPLALVIYNAIHTGEIRPDLRECDRNTHQSVIDEAVNWIQMKNRQKGVLWISGPPKVGKSAVALSIARRLDRPTSIAKVAASFFFATGDPQRSNLRAFVPTLVYRLSVWMQDSVGKEIWRVLDQDPGILNATVEVQWTKLIVETVNAAYEKALSSMPPAVIIIDGLDECADWRDQIRVLYMIASCGPNFPLAFLISSRPESHLLNEFNTRSLSSLCRPSINLGPRRATSQRAQTVPAPFGNSPFSSFPNFAGSAPMRMFGHSQMTPPRTASFPGCGGVGPVDPIAAMSAFSGAYGFNRGGSTHSSMFNNLASGGGAGLFSFMPPNTTYTDTARVDPTGGGTNAAEDVIFDIVTWVESTPRDACIVWLFGPAGSGSSNILTALKMRLSQPNAQAKIAAFFSFERRVTFPSNFVQALSSQLSMSNDALGQEVRKATAANPAAFFAPLGVQWDKLIVEPVRRAFSEHVGLLPAVIILDGLEQCGSQSNQKGILELIAFCGPNFPLAFIITSKPEPHLVQAFDTPSLSSCHSKIDTSRCINNQLDDILIAQHFS